MNNPKLPFLYPERKEPKMDEFVKQGFAKLPNIPDPIDVECTINTLQSCYKDGYSLEDAVKYAKYTEHVSPNLPERFACDQMKIIAMKYTPEQFRKGIK